MKSWPLLPMGMTAVAAIIVHMGVRTHVVDVTATIDGSQANTTRIYGLLLWPPPRGAVDMSSIISYPTPSK